MVDVVQHSTDHCENMTANKLDDESVIRTFCEPTEFCFHKYYYFIARYAHF